MDTAKQFVHDTIEDIYNLPEGQRAELIDGEMYMMVAPDRIHQKLVRRTGSLRSFPRQAVPWTILKS